MIKREIVLVDGVLEVETNGNDKQWEIATRYLRGNTNNTIEEAKKFLKGITSLKIIMK